MNNRKELQGSSIPKSDEGRELKQFVNRIRSNYVWIIISLVISLAVALIYVRYKTPSFLITAKILVNDNEKGGGLGGDSELLNLSSLLGTKSSVDNEAEVLKTRSLMERVVNDLHANITYFYNGRIRRVELYDSPFIVKVLNVRDSLTTNIYDLRLLDNGKLNLSSGNFSKIVEFNRPFILAEVGKVQIEKNPGIPFVEESYSFELSSVDSKVAEMMKGLKVAVTNKQVSTIDLSIYHGIPRKGEDILANLIKNYVESNLRDKNTIADSTISFIENRLLYVADELGDIEGSIQSFKQIRRVADISEQSKILIQNSSQYVEELAKIETQIAIINSLQEYLVDDTKNRRVLPTSVLPDDIVFVGLVERYNTLLLELDRQSLSATENNPYVRNLEDQVASVRKDLLSNLVNSKNSLSISKVQLQKRTSTLEGEIRKVPATERQFLDLSRQQQIKQELYIFLLQKREETAISKTSNIPNSKVIDPPKSYSKPVSPNKTIVVLFGLFAGLFIPLTVFYFQEQLNTRILSKDEIQAGTSVSILSEIGNNPTESTIVVDRDSRTPISEQFRGLRTNLQFYLKDGEKVILLTSSMSGEGKSFIALNLGSALSLSGKKVVLMETDLRKPTLTSKLGFENDFGFTNFVIDSKLLPQDIIKPSGIHSNLNIISSGPIPPNPAEILMDERVSSLVEYLKSSYDYIIIDAPPVGIVTDAQLLDRHSDLTIYVVRQGYTYKDQLQIVEELKTSGKMKRISLVVNDIPTTGSYGYGYGYSYGYGDYGNEQAKKKSFGIINRSKKTRN